MGGALGDVLRNRLSRLSILNRRNGLEHLGLSHCKKKSKKEKESKGRKGIKKPNEAESAKDENKYTFGGGIGGWALLNGHSGLGRLGLGH